MLRHVRIADPLVKIGLVTVWLVLMMTVAIAAAVSGRPLLVQWIGTLGVVVLVVLTGRTFRLPGESERPWWQLTGRSGSGFVVTALFVTSVLVTLIAGAGPSGGALVVQLCVAASYAASSTAIIARPHLRRRAGARG